jgi:hypothetical protein
MYLQGLFIKIEEAPLFAIEKAQESFRQLHACKFRESQNTTLLPKTN